MRFGSAAQTCPLLLSGIDETSTKGVEERAEGVTEGTLDKLSAILAPCHPPAPPGCSARRQAILPSCGGNPSAKTPRPNSRPWGRDGTPDGPDEISCIVQSTVIRPISPLRSSLTYTPGRRAREGQGAHAPSNLPGLCIRREIGRY